ncbi:DUF1684 domain-containing protein [Streptomyces sp. 7N604]|uniref:DUF1684 domain-containing protein n=1 Tax=Streptomyces sp. 7N604 TaxID=3457415 RepID=UPI003FD49DFE
MSDDDAEQQWKARHEHRAETVSAPYGPPSLTASLTGTYWQADVPDSRIPDILGRWTARGEEVVDHDRSLWTVFAGDISQPKAGGGTSGSSSFRFRFPRAAAPTADTSVTLDVPRAVLPPRAFTEHFIRPFPPPGNTPGFAVAAGERNKQAR